MRIVPCPPVQPAREAHSVHHRLERFHRDLLRDKADQSARRAVVAGDVVAAHRGLPARGRDEAAEDGDEGGLPGPVRTEQGEDFAFADIERDTGQRDGAAGIGLGEVADLDDRGHGVELLLLRGGTLARRRGDFQ